MKAFLTWLLAGLLALISLGAFKESIVGGAFLAVAAAFVVPPVWQRLSSKTGFAYRKAAVATASIIGMVTWIASPGFQAGMARTKAQREAELKQAASAQPGPPQASNSPTAATLDPNVFILKCAGEGLSDAKLGTDESSDPADEELFIKVDMHAETLQVWINNNWSDWCLAGSKCQSSFTNTKLTYRSVLNERDGDEASASTETWSLSRGDGKYSHVDEIEQRTNGKLTLTRKVMVRGTCVKVDKPTPDPGL